MINTASHLFSSTMRITILNAQPEHFESYINTMKPTAVSIKSVYDDILKDPHIGTLYKSNYLNITSMCDQLINFKHDWVAYGNNENYKKISLFNTIIANIVQKIKHPHAIDIAKAANWIK